MAEAADCAAWDRVALLWRAIAEPNRNRNSRKQPYLPSDVHPYRSAEFYEPEDDGEPDHAFLDAMIRQQQLRRQQHVNGQIN